MGSRKAQQHPPSASGALRLLRSAIIPPPAAALASAVSTALLTLPRARAATAACVTSLAWGGWGTGVAEGAEGGEEEARPGLERPPQLCRPSSFASQLWLEVPV